MKKLIAITLSLAALSAFGASTPAEPVVTVDLYGNVFLNGENTNSQIADFARNNPALAPQVDGAVRDAALNARTYIAAQVKAAQDSAAAQIAAKEAEKTAALASAQTARTTDLAAKDAQIAASAAYIAKLQKALRDAGQPVPLSDPN